MLLDGKALLITGAGGGIGRAAAIAATREGARLMLADLDEQAAAQVAREVRSGGGQADSVKVDIGDPAQVEYMIERSLEALGGLDAAFNNAGLGSTGSGGGGLRLGELPDDAWERVIRTNLTGTWLCMKAEIAHFAECGGGAILNMASISGLRGMALSGAYVASKHGVVGLTRSASIEYAADNIRINCICPGLVDTNFLPVRLRETAEPPPGVPLGRLGTPEEIAELAIWMLSDRASYMAGAAVTVDGGFTAK
ncbi:MAG: SDR family NAD(P)-dependent oxidoreductase [Sphingomonadaceae bacterium]